MRANRQPPVWYLWVHDRLRAVEFRPHHVAEPNRISLQEAKKAEKSKIAAIEKKYIVPAAERYKLVPCAAEVTGTLGEQFRSILGKVSQSVDPDGDESPYGPAHSPKDAFDRVVWRHKARIVASVTRGVVRELNRYMRAVHAKHGV